MQIPELSQGLRALFEHSRLVFWYDPEQTFAESLPLLELPEVDVLNLAAASLFETKKRLEIDQPQQRFLLYFPYAEPEPDEDWLLDIREYSCQFFADHGALLLNELGLQRLSLRGHLIARKPFFNKARLNNLKRWLTVDEDELSLDRKMIAVLLKAESAELTDIVLSLAQQQPDVSQPDTPNLGLLSIEKFGLLESFWQLLRLHYAYQPVSVSSLDLSHFWLTLCCTELYSQLPSDAVDWLKPNVLMTTSGRATALALLSSWRDRRRYADAYQQISASVGQQLALEQRYAKHLPYQLQHSQTFLQIEQQILRGLCEQLLESQGRIDRVAFDRIIAQRLEGYWCQPDSAEGEHYAGIYQALRQAAVLYGLRQQYDAGFHYPSSQAMYHAYCAELYQFDQAYRLFNQYADRVQSKGADLLRGLDQAIEALYSDWYLYELGLTWDHLLLQEHRLQHWRLPEVPSQQGFYQREVQRRLQATQTTRVFVIISDALRYEVAQELTTQLNTEKRLQAELSSQLGVLPSYTQLGMAALLPHQKLSYRPDSNSSTVYVDGQSSQGIEGRDQILRQANGIALDAKTLMTWSNEQGRAAVQQAQVVYIYHDTIDGIGDKQVTENKTFEACHTAICELRDLIGRVINRLNASRVIVTADHGFLFQQQALKPADKTKLQQLPPDLSIIEAKKRYVLGVNLPTDDSCWHGQVVESISATGNINSGVDFLLPKAAQRFHFIGGARFVHGGAMLQEICVPVIHVRSLDKQQAAKQQKAPVDVVLAHSVDKLVSHIETIRVLQSDPVGEQYSARVLSVYVTDEDGHVLSSLEKVTFDSTQASLAHRQREVTLKLIGHEFKRSTPYYLVFKDQQSHQIYMRHAVVIDLAMQSDFF